MERNQAEEMSRAVDKFTEAVREFTWSINRLSEHEEQLAWNASAIREAFERSLFELERRSSGGLSDEVAGKIADESVHRVRKELAREPADQAKAPPPTPEEVEDWQKRRQERRRREAS